jgi:hypothetical protein
MPSRWIACAPCAVTVTISTITSICRDASSPAHFRNRRPSAARPMRTIGTKTANSISWSKSLEKLNPLVKTSTQIDSRSGAAR